MALFGPNALKRPAICGAIQKTPRVFNPLNIRRSVTHRHKSHNAPQRFPACLSALPMHLWAPLPRRDRKDLEHVGLLEQKSGWIQNEFGHDGSVKHPYSPRPTTSSSSSRKPLTHPPDVQTGARHAQSHRGSGGGGWPILIPCLLYLEGEEANGAFLTRLTLDQSHHTFSQGTSAFLPSSPSLCPPALCTVFVLSFIFILLKAKRERGGKKKNKVGKGCPPGSQQREGRGGAQIALQKTGLRAEISHNAADKKVGHITFGKHVTRMQTAWRRGRGGKMLWRRPERLGQSQEKEGGWGRKAVIKEDVRCVRERER